MINLKTSEVLELSKISYYSYQISDNTLLTGSTYPPWGDGAWFVHPPPHYTEHPPALWDLSRGLTEPISIFPQDGKSTCARMQDNMLISGSTTTCLNIWGINFVVWCAWY